MELNVSFINQVRVFLLFFLNLFILRGMALRFRVFFSSAYKKKMSLLGFISCCDIPLSKAC